MLKSFSIINLGHKTTDPGSSENTRQEVCQMLSGHTIFKLQYIKKVAEVLIEAGGRKNSSLLVRKDNIYFLFCRNHEPQTDERIISK